jgi:hypothetical protein
MEFVSQIFPRDGRQIGPICPRGKIWETFFANTLSFTGTKIFPQKMSTAKPQPEFIKLVWKKNPSFSY